MAKKRYTVKTACPQCGCSRAQVLTAEEMKAKYGHVANFDMECSECQQKYQQAMEAACPEWAKECRLPE